MYEDKLPKKLIKEDGMKLLNNFMNLVQQKDCNDILYKNKKDQELSLKEFTKTYEDLKTYIIDIESQCNKCTKIGRTMLQEKELQEIEITKYKEQKFFRQNESILKSMHNKLMG